MLINAFVLQTPSQTSAANLRDHNVATAENDRLAPKLVARPWPPERGEVWSSDGFQGLPLLKITSSPCYMKTQRLKRMPYVGVSSFDPGLRLQFRGAGESATRTSAPQPYTGAPKQGEGKRVGGSTTI